jgi:uncharacterized protein
MYQKWRDLFFLHWEVAPEKIQKMLPKGLFVDTFGGKAYVGIVPFWMHGIRLCFLPPIPLLSHCVELNVRTYVINQAGVPGIWFFSLDISNALHAYLARKFYFLPYYAAHMEFNKTQETYNYSLKRKESSHFCLLKLKQSGNYFKASPSSLPYFLIERYLLYTFKKGNLFSAEVRHAPYLLTHAESIHCEQNLWEKGTESPFIFYSPGVNVRVSPLY